MRRPLQSTSQSPSRQRPGDALLSRLTPASAVEALRVPSGPLKACLDEASLSEQHFAIKTAIASRKIHDWLDELLEWPWPKENTYAGFEMPPAKRRLLESRRANMNRNPDQDQQGAPEPEIEYLGSLPAGDIVRYEIRIEQVQKGMGELDLEEIKSHVLLNHIMPLSRPGTPYSDAGRSIASSISFTKMEDITAVITAITVQALPNVSRLTRLLSTWSIRIVVLRKVPSVLMMITDAEIALKSGWNAIEDQKPIGDTASDVSNSTALSQQDFEVMNSVLRKKVARPGKELDYMLDVLEGMRDTLPDEWLERMDAVEKDYADWVAMAERRVREGELGDAYSPSKLDTWQAAPRTPQLKIQVQTPSPTRDPQENETAGHGLTILIKGPSSDIPSTVDQVPDLGQNEAQQKDTDLGKVAEDVSPGVGLGITESPAATRKIQAGFQTERTKARDLDGSANNLRVLKASTALSELNHNVLRTAPPEALEPSPLLHSKRSVQSMDGEFSFLESVYEDDEDDEDADEPQLPPPSFQYRRDSQISMASTVLHDPASIISHSDDVYFREASFEPELPRLPDPDQPFSSDALSPPSSPPLRYKARTHSVSFNEIPEISELPEEDVTPPRSPLEPPEVFDPESSFGYGAPMSSPGNASVISETGDDLHQQIRRVLKGLPNNIQLSTRPSAINLNPPDFQHPSRPKPKAPDTFRRSGSALSTRSTMSSRASTPSWMLAPARTPRPQSRAEIKTYYLSRANGEAPMKLLIRCVGENGERVMVRVGGGWADLGEYLKEYAIHHSRRSKGEGKVEVRDSSTLGSSIHGSSPPSRPGSALEAPMTPLVVRKTRRSTAGEGSSRQPTVTRPPGLGNSESPPSDTSVGSRGSRAMSQPNSSSILGMAGPHPKKARALSEESRQWIEDVRNKVRSVSGEQRAALEQTQNGGKFGELGKVGGTKRVYRKNLA
ncbi:hypothetical protein BKA67DRAFT_657036 [Truncatella angustata]|uniref:GAR domain-containing protein n=1 Tax=Truncatella angustata TaxID=152316 RepID=A0A9P8UN84_9PEZI|nr:uncharacterized protein BKA67DRAFT_657036 [Truncatella angustata]KAH6655076.1 hypothetical protein BKA67DRAFT_657036 [Truncatella angustata]